MTKRKKALVLGKTAVRILTNKFVVGAFSVVLLIAGYNYVSARQHEKNSDDTTIPSAKQLWSGVQKIFKPDKNTGDRWIVEDSKATMGRLFMGLSIGVSASIVLGVLMGCFRIIQHFFNFPLLWLSKFPPTAMLAVFFVMVGTGTEMYVTMIAFGVLPILTMSIFLAVREVPKEHLDMARTRGASISEVIWDVIFKQILPKIFDNIRLQIGPAMVYLIAAEMVCGDVGFGYRIRTQSRLLNMNVVYPYLILLASFGFLMDWLINLSRRLICQWCVKEHS